MSVKPVQAQGTALKISAGDGEAVDVSRNDVPKQGTTLAGITRVAGVG